MSTHFRMAVAAAMFVLLAGCATGPSRSEDTAEMGYRAAAAGDLRLAEDLLVQAREQEPKNAEVLVSLGEVYQQTGRAEPARAMYLGALALAPEVNAAPTEAERLAGQRAIERAGENLKQLYLAERGELPQAEPGELPQDESLELPRPEPVVKMTAAVESAPFAYWVQLGYFTQPGNAQRLSAQFGEIHAALAQDVEVRLVEADDGGTRVRIGPFPTKGAADRACLRLRAAKADCFPGSRRP